MLTVEACLGRLSDVASDPVKDAQGNLYEITNTWDRRFIADVSQHVNGGAAISTAQSSVVLKLITRYRDHLIASGIHGPTLDALLLVPQYKTPPYQSTVMPREVRWAGDSKLIFRCKFNAGIQEDIKRLKGYNHFLPHQFPVFNREHKLWIVDINSGNWERAMDIIKRHNFSFDDQVAEFFLECANSAGKPSEIVTKSDHIEITVRDDDFLASWVNGIKALEG